MKSTGRRAHRQSCRRRRRTSLVRRGPCPKMCPSITWSASSEREVEVALSALKLYGVRHFSFRSWRDATKAFDDWRCVLLGPAVNRWWQLHQIAQPEESSASPHTACLLSLLGGDHASTCMHAWSMRDASMRAIFPRPSDRLSTQGRRPAGLCIFCRRVARATTGSVF